jgi:hypothetical protein
LSYVFGANAGGKTKFTEGLDALMGLSGERIENILIVSDNDTNPRKSFRNIVSQIEKSAEILDTPKRKLIAPSMPFVKSPSDPSISIVMLPDTGVVGSLDTMCLKAASNKSPVMSTHVDRFAELTESDKWPIGKLEKMKLRCHLSASWKADPSISPAYVWSTKSNLVPLADPVFDKISDFLKIF